ncbi:MAG: 30S ribosomal protein S6 [Phycisphaerae bacterium]|nr:30S ribosomal protein S6 [Phycisphaerae bacterium]
MTTGVMRKYEGLFLVDSAYATTNYDEAVAAISTVMERAKAEVVSLKKWDDRRLCYEIKSSTRGTYFLCNFNAMPEMISPLERDVQISEEILRVMVLNAERIPEEILVSATPLERCEKIEAEEAQAEEQDEESLDDVAIDTVED